MGGTNRPKSLAQNEPKYPRSWVLSKLVVPLAVLNYNNASQRLVDYEE